jgi:hypothetical protein
MARCTAPVEGHRSASAEANCPVCRYKPRRFGGYMERPIAPYAPIYPPRTNVGGSDGASSGGAVRTRASWSKAGSSVLYTQSELRSLTPIRQTFEKKAVLPDLRDVFLCHAWDDRQGAAKELHDLLEARGVSVWFSEKDVPLGSSLLREIDKGLAKSRIGIVLVTPALLRRLPAAGVADKELSALLATEQLVPIVHDTTYEALRDVSPLLASRAGLDTAENLMAGVAAKLAELVTL